MQVWVNDQQVTIPSSINEITLLQRIQFQEQYGNQLEEMAQSILLIEDEFERDLEMAQFQFEQMFKTFSFFSGISEQVLKDSAFIDQIAGIYYSCMNQMFEQQNEMELETEFAWNGELWILDKPELKNGGRMLFGEFIDSKQIIQDMVGLSKNRWECLVPLCAIFLRREGEAYQESFLYEGSERLELMKTLPFNIAMQVGFFLNGSLAMFKKTFQYLDPQELRATENMLRSTMSNGAG